MRPAYVALRYVSNSRPEEAPKTSDVAGAVTGYAAGELLVDLLHLSEDAVLPLLSDLPSS